MRLPTLRQPDQRTCGPACLVRARMLQEPSYHRTMLIPGAFDREVLALHRRVTGPIDVSGRLQLPWPRALGTPPWAVARQLSWRSPSGGYGVRLALGAARGPAVGSVVRSVGAGQPAVLYVGSRWLPRHVVLVHGGDADALGVYDPGPGADRTVRTADLATGRVGFGRWDRLWFVVVPRAAGQLGVGR